MSENSPFKYDVADASPGFLLWKLMGLWQARLSQTLSVFEITQTQYAILASLRWLQEHQQLSGLRIFWCTDPDLAPCWPMVDFGQ